MSRRRRCVLVALSLYVFIFLWDANCERTSPSLTRSPSISAVSSRHAREVHNIMKPLVLPFTFFFVCVFFQSISSFVLNPTKSRYTCTYTNPVTVNLSKGEFRNFLRLGLCCSLKFSLTSMYVIDTDKDTMTSLTTSIVEIDKPDDQNVIVGMTHFIKTVDDIHEALVGSVPAIKFGLAFCEASGDRLVRWTGTDEGLIELAKSNALAVGCGHSFILFLGPPTFPIHVLNQLKMVPEVCRIFCATANKVQLVIAESPSGRGIMGVIDGQTPVGVETQEDIDNRRQLLKKFGYKL
jgi:adenosine/AMP kinase